MVQRVPKLVDEAVGQDLLGPRVIWESSDQLNRSFHEHGLVILLSFALELGRDDTLEGLEFWAPLASADGYPKASAHHRGRCG